MHALSRINSCSRHARVAGTSERGAQSRPGTDTAHATLHKLLLEC